VAMDHDDGRGIDAVAMCADVPWLRIWVVLCAAPVRSRGNGALLVYPPGRVPTHTITLRINQRMMLLTPSH
jgi:hypothetical protein